MLTDRFDRALGYASRIHRAQIRTGTAIPYVAHLLAVSSLALEHGGDEDQAIAALLHDAAEDQGGRDRLCEIERLFGPRIARIVEDCTDTFDDPKPAWLPRKEGYIRSLAAKPEDSLLVSLADKTHNSQSILTDLMSVGEAIWSRFSGGRDGTLWYYRSLSAVFEERVPGPLARQLARNVDSLVELDRALDKQPEDCGIAQTHDIVIVCNGARRVQRLYDTTDEWAEEYAEVLRRLPDHDTPETVTVMRRDRGA